ncbi:SSI family serine proteinase inhibitor [Streptomyces sp. SCSIO 75703]|uniref:SSI family serine proteinase inhibitor n=1 Tax=unclassified Streptomyces TaxID=2593676 RepID=UPI0006B40DAA|nr:SSI family serine proteinase inhibitor [Streptomyces sp. TP-A0875]
MVQLIPDSAARRLGTVVVSVAALASLSSAAYADAGPFAGHRSGHVTGHVTGLGAGHLAGSGGVWSPVPPAPGDEAPAGDHLTITVRDAGPGADGSYELYCRPGGGSHPDPDGACAVVDGNARWGQETFAPVPEGSICTLQYGGPATAHVTGVWDGRAVNATYDRSNGCEISRWDRMVPLLPDLRAPGAGA